MKLFVLLFVVHLSLSALVPKADKLDALRAQKIPLEAQKLTGAPLVEYLKKNQKLFQVDPTPAVDRYKRMVMDLKYSKEKPKAKLTVVKDENDDGGDIPDSFDGRSQWGWMCPSLWYIRDQSLCGSCWALSSAAAMSDRLCIATNGAVQVELSGDDILSCCKDCGKGCDGGWPLYAFDYFSFTGTVTGGNYGTQDCCRPYEIPPCGYHAGEPYYDCNAMYKGTPACVKECQPGYYKTYPMDKYYGIASYSLPNSVTEIQRDIMKYGSVVGTFTVYEDFYNYKSGIYKHTAGNEIGSHAVKIVGWGQEGDTPYWIIANSWHNDWGENGFFRMIRGINDCGIEESVVAVLVGNGQK